MSQVNEFQRQHVAGAREAFTAAYDMAIRPDATLEDVRKFLHDALVAAGEKTSGELLRSLGVRIPENGTGH